MSGFLESLRNWIPLAVTLTAVTLGLWVANWSLLTRHAGLGNERRLPRQLVMLGLTVAGIVAVALSLPVSESSRNQVIALVGVLLSGAIAFSSATVFTNVMAGMMIRVTRPFQTGDFIRVDDHFGRVTERGLLDTEIQTEHRELVSIPNSLLVARPVTVVRSSGAIIWTEVSLGYDVHHAEAERQLLAAARAAGLTDPFVQVLQLGDYSVTHRVSGLLSDVSHLLSARSRLRRGVLDALHGAGIEIASPRLIAQRPTAPDHRWMPERNNTGPEVRRTPAESVVFDKAEEAARRERERQAIEAEHAELTARHRQASGDEREALAARLKDLAAALAAAKGTVAEADAAPPHSSPS